MIPIFIELYAAILLVVILHELGHRPKHIKIVKWFPIPEGAAMEARSRYGGLIMNAMLFAGIWYIKPEELFIQLIGFAAWAHFVFYSIAGSINRENKVPKEMEKYFVFDDIPNEFACVFIPLGIAVFLYLKDYYLPVILQLL